MDERQLIDALAQVMGWEVDRNGFFDGEYVRPNWNPLQNIADAWMLVEKLTERADFALEKDCDSSGWICEVTLALNYVRVGKGETAQEAICNAVYALWESGGEA